MIETGGGVSPSVLLRPPPLPESALPLSPHPWIRKKDKANIPQNTVLMQLLYRNVTLLSIPKQKTLIFLFSVPSFSFTSQGSGMSLFRVASLFGGLTRFEAMKNLYSCLSRGCRNNPVGNTSRGKRLRVSSASAVQLETSYISTDDRFAALLKSSCHSAWVGGGRGATALPLRVTVAGRCPAYVRFTVLWLSFLSCAVSRFEIVVSTAM